MKKVFSNNRQLAHVWAQQKQESGTGNNMFFSGPTLYSYGLHFVAGYVHKSKSGEYFAVLNSENYSNSTAKHLGHAWHAVHRLMRNYRSPSPTSLKDTMKHLDSLPVKEMERSLKKIKITCRHDIDYVLNRITELYGEANSFRELIGKKSIKHNIGMRSKVNSHLEKRLARYKELNTPENIQKRELEKERREELKNKRELEEQKESISKWRSGESVSVYGLQYSLLRIKDERVQTSGGAEVPLRQAKTLMEAINSGKNVSGYSIGHFEVDSITETGSDSVIKIGCHRILLSEAKRLFP